MVGALFTMIASLGGALGRKFELIAFDNKSNPADALLGLKSATDQNMPFICIAAARTSPRR